MKISPPEGATPINILQQGNYFISFNILGNNQSEIRISWLNKKYLISYDSNTHQLSIGQQQYHIYHEYAILAIVLTFLKQICNLYRYPPQYVVFLLDGNKISDPKVVYTNSNDTKGKDFQYLIDTLEVEGLTAGLVELALEQELFGGLQDYCKIFMKINIEPVEKNNESRT